MRATNNTIYKAACFLNWKQPFLEARLDEGIVPFVQSLVLLTGIKAPAH